MNSTRRWPSRRACTAIFLVLALGAAIRAFVPPINRQARAQQLYEDAWFHDWTFSDLGRKPSQESVNKLEAALKLCPDNSLYQQALVWKYPKNKLPQLIKERKLSPEALRLAYGLLSGSEIGLVAPEKRGQLKTNALRRASELKGLDGGNSIAFYNEASYLVKEGRLDEAYDDVRLGNRLGAGYLYEPELSESIRGTMLSSVGMEDYQYLAAFQSVARELASLGNRRLQTGDAKGACEALEECCRMGVNLAATKPWTFDKGLTARAIFSVGFKPLSAICKDFGMKGELDRYSRMNRAFEKDQREFYDGLSSADSMNGLFAGIIVRYAIPFSATGGLALSVLFTAILFLGWQVWAVAQRRKQRSPVAISPWGEGHLARLFLAVYLPIYALSTLLAVLVHFSPVVRKLDVITCGIAMYIPIGLVALGQIIVLALLTGSLRRAYVEATGERVGLLRFVFLGPAERQAWRLKNAARALCGQLAFSVCVACLVIIVYKPIFGHQAWQIERIPYNMLQTESSNSNHLVSDLAKAAPADWHVGK